MTRLVPLGTNGFFPTFGRQTMSFLVLAGGQALLLDAGTGVSSLVEPAVEGLLAPITGLDIVLSHYHLDHVIGLSYMPAVWTRGRIRVFGPARPLVETEPETALNQLLGPPLFSARYQSFPAPLELIAVRQEEFTIGKLPVRVRSQEHPGGSVGIRIGDEIAYLTDTSAGPSGLDLARGVKLLIHELWLTDAEAEGGLSGHSHFSGVAGFVKDAGVRSAMLVHHHPRRTDSEIRQMSEMMAKRTGVPVIVAGEAQVYELD
jgi:ribonuclease BN (tRNA processing enzyme)